MFAHDFAYQALLGGSFHHLYAPWKIVEWAIRYGAGHTLALKRAASLGIVLSSILMIIPLFRLMRGILD
jgi:type IV secretion system protein VirD4